MSLATTAVTSGFLRRVAARGLAFLGFYSLQDPKTRQALAGMSTYTATGSPTLQTRPTYRVQWRLFGHTRPVNCLKFSDCGHFLASGADDGHVIVWSLIDGALLQRIRPKQGPIHALEWLYPQSSQDAILLFGGADGTVQIWRKRHEQGQFDFDFIYTAIEGAVESMALDEARSLLAVVGLGRVVVLRLLYDSNGVTLQPHASEPPAFEPGRNALARAVAFFDSGRALMVGYLDSKQILAWNVQPWGLLWSVKLRTRIGGLAWSSTSQTILVSNLHDGVDVYCLKDRPYFERRMLVPRIRRNVPQQVCLAQNGQLVISGSDKGEVYFWERNLGGMHQALRHGGIYCNQSIASHSPQDGTHLIASGSSDLAQSDLYITVWATTKLSWYSEIFASSRFFSSQLLVFGVLPLVTVILFAYAYDMLFIESLTTKIS